jgi:DNA-directed RNA polymerase subunit RPC12/RpoP
VDLYFCPRCGENFSSVDCKAEGELLRCPDCPQVRVMMRGRGLVAVGLIVLLVTTQVLPPYLPVIGILVGGGLCVTGMTRSIRQRMARKRVERENNPNLILREEYSDGDDEESPD